MRLALVPVFLLLGLLARDCATDESSSCCRVCRTGKPCGDSCIADSERCTRPVGCACYPLVSSDAGS